MFKNLYLWLTSLLMGKGHNRLITLEFVRSLPHSAAKDRAVLFVKQTYAEPVSPARFWADYTRQAPSDDHWALMIGLFFALISSKYGKDLRTNYGGRVGELARLCVNQTLPHILANLSPSAEAKAIIDALVEGVTPKTLKPLTYLQLGKEMYHAESVIGLATYLTFQTLDQKYHALGYEKLFACAQGAADELESSTLGWDAFVARKEERWAGEHDRTYWQARQEQIEFCKQILKDEGLWL